MGGNYLDPRSFGGYDDFNSSISYELPTSFVDNNSQSEKKKKKRDFSNCIKFSEPSSYVSGRVRQRFDSAKHGFAWNPAEKQHSYCLSGENCRASTQYAVHPCQDFKVALQQQEFQWRSTSSPLKTSSSASNLISGASTSRRPTSSRQSTKKEPIDPKKVEDEVAR